MQPSHKTVVLLLSVVIFMFGFTFALAPLYNVLCRSTGWNGTINLVPYVSNTAPDLEHPITVQFVTMNNANLPWNFVPQQLSLTTHLEENTKIMYTMKNNTNKSMTVQAIPGITPWQAAKYFHKVECFCFRQQTLAAGESLTIPVIFRVDHQLPRDIHVITLAYTLFDVTHKKGLQNETH